MKGRIIDLSPAARRGAGYEGWNGTGQRRADHSALTGDKRRPSRLLLPEWPGIGLTGSGMICFVDGSLPNPLVGAMR